MPEHTHSHDSTETERPLPTPARWRGLLSVALAVVMFAGVSVIDGPYFGVLVVEDVPAVTWTPLTSALVILSAAVVLAGGLWAPDRRLEEVA